MAASMAYPNFTMNLPSQGYLIYRDSAPDLGFDPTAPLAFFPPKDSDELFDALRLKYPTLKTHSERMRDAIIEFLLEERAVDMSPLMVTEDITADLASWDQSWQSMPSTTTCSSVHSSPEINDLATPDYNNSPHPSYRQHNPITSCPTSTATSTPQMEQMTGVFAVSASNQPRQRIRRKMTEAEKIEYRRRRIVKACEKCSKRKRKCQHNQPEMDHLAEQHSRRTHSRAPTAKSLPSVGPSTNHVSAIPTPAQHGLSNLDPAMIDSFMADMPSFDDLSGLINDPLFEQASAYMDSYLFDSYINLGGTVDPKATFAHTPIFHQSSAMSTFTLTGSSSPQINTLDSQSFDQGLSDHLWGDLDQTQATASMSRSASEGSQTNSFVSCSTDESTSCRDGSSLVAPRVPPFEPGTNARIPTQLISTIADKSSRIHAVANTTSQRPVTNADYNDTRATAASGTTIGLRVDTLDTQRRVPQHSSLQAWSHSPATSSGMTILQDVASPQDVGVIFAPAIEIPQPMHTAHLHGMFSGGAYLEDSDRSTLAASSARQASRTRSSSSIDTTSLSNATATGPSVSQDTLGSMSTARQNSMVNSTHAFGERTDAARASQPGSDACPVDGASEPSHASRGANDAVFAASANIFAMRAKSKVTVDSSISFGADAHGLSSELYRLRHRSLPNADRVIRQAKQAVVQAGQTFAVNASKSSVLDATAGNADASTSSAMSSAVSLASASATSSSLSSSHGASSRHVDARMKGGSLVSSTAVRVHASSIYVNTDQQNTAIASRQTSIDRLSDHVRYRDHHGRSMALAVAALLLCFCSPHSALWLFLACCLPVGTSCGVDPGYETALKPVNCSDQKSSWLKSDTLKSVSSRVRQWTTAVIDSACPLVC